MAPPIRKKAATGRQHPRQSIAAGWLLIAAGLLSHKWALERLLAADERIDGLAFQAAILLLQLGCIVAGMALVRRPLRVPAARAIVLAIAVVGLTIGVYGNLRALGLVDPHRELRARWVEINDSEELIVEITPALNSLARAARDLGFPGPENRALFADGVEMNAARLAAVEDRWRYGEAELVRRAVVVEPAPHRVAVADTVWEELLNGVEYFRHADFHLLAANFDDPDRRLFSTDIEFDGLARTADGRWAWLRLEQRVRWERQAARPPRIVAWRTRGGSWLESDRLFFGEVLDRALPAATDLERARRSRHEELMRAWLMDPAGDGRPERPFLPGLTRHPGLAVVDLDRDGLDDLYVLVRWGENLFFHNRGNGTFEERAADLGLAIRDHSSAALFADFDNDGDDDVFVGRTLAPSLYLVNEGGRFRDRSSDLVDSPLPCLVSALSAADYDGDGLLDLYAATYAGDVERHVLAEPPLELGGCLSAGDRQAWRRRARSGEDLLRDKAGPPNVMLRKAGGGRFELARGSAAARLFRQSYQATWSDFDLDGDPDLYVVNDFATNNLLRNDGGGVFSDVTAAQGVADLGFGMGASWGDYDLDGRPDLYVSNMHSHAGHRIATRLDDLDPRLLDMTRGNSLFRNTASGFTRVSSAAPPGLDVELAGWSWASQFIDVDGDGRLDLYAPSGFYTAPRPFDLPVDL